MYTDNNQQNGNTYTFVPILWLVGLLQRGKSKNAHFFMVHRMRRRSVGIFRWLHLHKKRQVHKHEKYGQKKHEILSCAKNFGDFWVWN